MCRSRDAGKSNTLWIAKLTRFKGRYHYREDFVVTDGRRNDTPRVLYLETPWQIEGPANTAVLKSMAFASSSCAINQEPEKLCSIPSRSKVQGNFAERSATERAKVDYIAGEGSD